MKLSDIIKFHLDGIIIQDCEFEIFGLVGKDYPSDLRVITFLSNAAFVHDFLKCNMKGVICTDEIAEILKCRFEGGICIADDPKSLFFHFHNNITNEKKCNKKASPNLIHPTTVINPTASIARNGVVIGANTLIGANTIIHEGVTIGDNVIIREGCMIGTPAFYYFGSGDQRTRVESTGTVIVEDNVEIHTNVTICRGVLGGSTKIGRNTKIDSHIFIGHDVQISDNCTIAANSTFGGWSSLQSNVFVGVSASFAPGVRVGRNAKISIGAVVTTEVPEGAQYSGNFAVKHNIFIDFIKSIAQND